MRSATHDCEERRKELQYREYYGSTVLQYREYYGSTVLQYCSTGSTMVALYCSTQTHLDQRKYALLNNREYAAVLYSVLI